MCVFCFYGFVLCGLCVSVVCRGLLLHVYARTSYSLAVVGKTFWGWLWEFLELEKEKGETGRKEARVAIKLVDGSWSWKLGGI